MSDNSDAADFESEESGTDFSVSEDDWVPNKSDRRKASSDSSEHDAFEESTKNKSTSASVAKNPKSAKASGSTATGRKKPLTLRAKMFKRYQPVPTSGNDSPSRIQANVKAILEQAQFEQKKNLTLADADSDSSGDDYLVKPSQIDLRSSFFDRNTKHVVASVQDEPKFDCNVGLRLSDSPSDDDDDEMEPVDDAEKRATSSIITKINQASSDNFKHLADFTANLNQAKDQLKNFQSKKFCADNTEIDISKLLAMGEAATRSPAKTSANSKSGTKRRASESDWEEVEEGQNESATVQENVEIIVPFVRRDQKARDKRALDLETCIRREINREKREKQLHLHKVSVLAWLAHGKFVNNILNSPSLMSQCVALLPSKQSFPKDKTDVKYFQQITTWFKTTMGIAEKTMYSKLSKRPKLSLSLALQIKTRMAICWRDYVLIFVLLLRGMGIQCRLVSNLATQPIRPLPADLLRIAPEKPEAEKAPAKQAKGKTTKSKPEPAKSKRSMPKREYSESSDSDASVAEVSPKKLRTRDRASKKLEPITSPLFSKDAKELPAPKKEAKSTEKSAREVSKRSSKKPEPITSPLFPKDTKASSESKTNGSTKKVAKPAEKLAREVSKRSSRVQAKKEANNDESTNFDQLDGGNDESPRRTRSKNAKATTKTAAAVASQNNNLSIIDEKAEVKQKKPNSGRKTATTTSRPTVVKTELLLSPRKTRSQSRSLSRESTPIPNVEPVKNDANPESGRKTATTTSRPTVVKTELLLSPRKTRSQSRSLSRESTPIPNVQPVKKAKKKPSTSSASKLVVQSPPEQSKIQRPVPQKRTADEAKPQLGKLMKAKSSAPVELKTPIKRRYSSDEEFQPASASAKKVVNKTLQVIKKIDKRVLSTDDDDAADKKPHPVPAKNSMDWWVEVFAEHENKWVPINLVSGKLNRIEDLMKLATAPVAYVYAWNNDNSIKDVTPRYCTQWNTVSRKLRVDKEWLEPVLAKYRGVRNARDIAEDKELNKIHFDQPLPKIISEFKNHPLYALKRHLLKFEAIYPAEPPTLGFIRGEVIYPRSCVYTLHSRDLWMKQARTVKPGEEPYKVVTARPKWDRVNNAVIKDIPLEVYGIWQTKDFEPPTAENGIVPRNAYGNVELFKSCMLPKKCVHLQLAGLNRVCKKLNIDCAAAVIGFDYHGGSSHVVLDGYVICEEFAEQAVAAWFIEQEESEQRDVEKYEKRVYGNWRKLIRGLMIRKKLQSKYNFDLTADTVKEETVAKRRKK